MTEPDQFSVLEMTLVKTDPDDNKISEDDNDDDDDDDDEESVAADETSFLLDPDSITHADDVDDTNNDVSINVDDDLIVPEVIDNDDDVHRVVFHIGEISTIRDGNAGDDNDALSHAGDMPTFQAEVHIDSCEDNDLSSPGFEVRYDSDIENAATSDGADSDTLDPSGFNEERRQSKWSTTILFVASEIQLMINLADFCPPEGFERRPIQPKQGEPDLNSNMEKDETVIEMQPKSENLVLEKEPEKNPDIPQDHEKGELIPIKDAIIKDEYDKPPVENWSGTADYLLAAIGYSVDLSNVWRFPYLAYKNGGGAFIIPYFTVLILGAIPVFFMELSMGQFSREGPINVWNNMVPMFRGVGMASCLMAYFVAFYYNMVIAWAFYYLFSSVTSTPPWAKCDHHFNTKNCWQNNWDMNMTSPMNTTYDNATSISSSFEFFERGVLSLHRSSGLNDLGPIKWQLALCAFLTFTIIYFCLWKSVKSAGKVVWFTATIPYIILTVLLVRGCLLPGSAYGIKYFITPNISRLGDVQVWIDAAVQIFFSIGAGFGTHIAYASYNKFNNNCYRDCLITASVNSFTSIYSGFVIFAYLGYMAEKQHKHIRDVAQDGPGLVFIVYPEAISTLPGSTAWAVLFFFMLVTLGMDSAFGGLESPLTGLRDQFYRVFRHRWSREVLTLVIIISAFLFSMPCMTVGGMYVFKILDAFAAGISLIFVVLMQVIGVAWIYGVDQFCDDIYQMTGHRPGYYWRVCWKVLSPTFLLIIVISSFLHYKPLFYRGSMGTYTYPAYANILGWCIALASMLLVPCYIVYWMTRNRGSFQQRLACGITPKKEHGDIRNMDTDVKRFKLRHWISI